MPPYDGPPQNTSTTVSNLLFCGQTVLTTFGFSDTLFLILLCLPFPWILANFPHILLRLRGPYGSAGLGVN